MVEVSVADGVIELSGVWVSTLVVIGEEDELPEG
jgi:hypothetical protein